MSNIATTPSPVPSPEKSSAAEQSHPLKNRISCFRSVRDRSPTDDCTIYNFFLNVKIGTYSAAVEQIRMHEAEGNTARADVIKKSLPAVSLSGLVTEGTRSGAFKEERFKHSGFLQGDFDAKDFHPRDPSEIKAMLASDEHVPVVFVSAKFGLKAFVRIPVCKTPAEHKAAFIAAESYFREKYGLILDASTKDPVRLCFASYDPDAYLDLSPATELPVPFGKKPFDGSKASRAAAPNEFRAANSSDSVTKHSKLSQESIKAMLACIPTRPDYDMWIKISSAVWAATEDEDIGTALLKEWSPEVSTGEYSEKYKTRLEEISAGTLIHFAKDHGYKFPSGQDAEGGDEIPDGVFPVPCGAIEYSRAGDTIFGVIAPTHQMFMRGGIVHEVVADGNEPAHLTPLSPERFCSLVENFNHKTKRREWQEGKGGKDKGRFVWRRRLMPVSSGKILLCSDAAICNLPPIRQLAACPILTKEGVVIGRGYHPHADGTFITEGEVPEEVPIAAATEAILGLLDDFNFVSPADKSRAVASILSPALKMGNWIDDDYPMDVAEADQSQSGKTYRQKLVNRIYNEIPSAITAPRGGVGSLDETISTALIKGRPFITLDNFRGKLDSTILEQAIRGASRVSCRALRTSAVVDTRPFNWQLSTNGAEFTRDIANRSIITRIRKQGAGYRFKEHAEGDLLAHVTAKQPFYLGAVFSVIQEWKRSGCPKTDENRHDFRGWCRSLDWIVQNIFKLPPLLDGHREEQARTANPALQWLRDLTMAAQVEGQLGRELTTIQLVRIAEDSGIEFPGSPSNREEPHQRAGKILAKLFRDSNGGAIPVDGLTVTREERSVHVPGRGNELQKIYRVGVAEK